MALQSSMAPSVRKITAQSDARISTEPEMRRAPAAPEVVRPSFFSLLIFSFAMRERIATNTKARTVISVVIVMRGVRPETKQSVMRPAETTSPIE